MPIDVFSALLSTSKPINDLIRGDVMNYLNNKIFGYKQDKTTHVIKNLD